jgi:hypothetical protein
MAKRETLVSVEVLNNVDRDFIVYVWKKGDYHYEVEALCSVTGNVLFKYESKDINMGDARFIADTLHKGLRNNQA